MFPTPTTVQRLPCRDCGTLTRVDRAVQGYGADCATKRGLIVRRRRLHASPQDGATLFDAADEDNACDGWDHPAG